MTIDRDQLLFEDAAGQISQTTKDAFDRIVVDHNLDRECIVGIDPKRQTIFLEIELEGGLLESSDEIGEPFVRFNAFATVAGDLPKWQLLDYKQTTGGEKSIENGYILKSLKDFNTSFPACF